MAKKIVAANWKMNLLKSEALMLYEEMGKILPENDVEVAVFSPSIFLSELIGSRSNRLAIGAQNFFNEEKGAYTGEISASQLKDLGCSYVLVGHSERRVLFSESDELIQKKVKAALDIGLKVIYCCGESLEERENNKHQLKISSQLETLKSFTPEELGDLAIAYEPIWAIGTGLTASPQQAEDMHRYIREELAKLFSFELAQGISILYGGSCNEKNAKELFQRPNIDGGLIGGASLNADSFSQIVDSFE
jgi:triosephosphate isomerase